MSDKIRQMIDETEIEISDEDRIKIDPDVKELMANKIANSLAKGVGNLNPVYDLLKKAHDEGKYPGNTAQGRGDNLRAYAERIAAMYVVTSGAGVVKREGNRSLLKMASDEKPFTDKDLTEELPHIPKATEKEAITE